MHTYDTVMKTTYIIVMMMMPAVTRQDIHAKSEKSIMYDIPNVHIR